MAEVAARQILEAIGLEGAPNYLIRDRGRKFGAHFSRQVALFGMREVLTAPALPWQSAFVERVIGTFRRECLDHTIILGEQHFRRTVKKYVEGG